MIEKFVSPHPRPTEHQQEILECLIEECAEVIQRATKMQRFGIEETQPDQPYSNMQRLSIEIGDLMEIIGWASSVGLVDSDIVKNQMPLKREKLKKYLQTEY